MTVLGQEAIFPPRILAATSKVSSLDGSFGFLLSPEFFYSLKNSFFHLSTAFATDAALVLPYHSGPDNLSRMPELLCLLLLLIGGKTEAMVAWDGPLASHEQKGWKRTL